MTETIKNIINAARSMLAVAVVALFGAATSNAQSFVFATANTSPAIRIYNGYTGTLSIACLNKGSNFTVTANGQAQSIAVTAFTNAASLAQALAAVTDASSRAYAYVDTSQCLPTDTMVGKLVTASNSVAAGGWIRLYYDTQANAFYQASVPKGVIFAPGQSFQVPDIDRGANVGFVVDRIYGQPTGTGTVTVTAYVNGQAAWQRAYTSPTYALGATATGATIQVDSVNVDEATSIRVGPTDSLIIRAVRATSALPTSGNIGASLNPRGL